MKEGITGQKKRKQQGNKKSGEGEQSMKAKERTKKEKTSIHKSCAAFLPYGQNTGRSPDTCGTCGEDH